MDIANTERYLYRKCLFSTVDFSSSSSTVCQLSSFLCIFYCGIMLYGIVSGHVSGHLNFLDGPSGWHWLGSDEVQVHHVCLQHG